jgi:hydrogenase nickel incorporation protein HypB
MHVIGVKKDVLDVNRHIAMHNREFFEEHKIFAINFMGAIGSGKTAMIEKLQKKLPGLRLAAIAGDIISDLDAGRIRKLGIPVVGVNTGKECHLDAHLVDHALDSLPTHDIDILFIENVGNLICPVDFDLGEQLKVTIVSVSEGDDTVEKHPMIFMSSDVAVINKIDIAKAVDASAEKMRDDAHAINKKLKVFMTSIKNDVGVDEFAQWIIEQYKKNMRE